MKDKMMMKYMTCAINIILSKASWLQALALLAARLWIAKMFFMSGLTKIGNWDTTVALFADEYKVPILPPELAAYLSTAAELTLPILLVLGLFTALAALGLMAMTLVIELFVFPGTTEHYYWLLLTGVLITHDSGKFGLDYWLMRYFGLGLKCGCSSTGTN